MLEPLINSLDYFDNQGNTKLERDLRIFLKELDKDLVAAGYAAPKIVIEALNNFNETLEEVEAFVDDNDLTDSEIVDTEFEDLEKEAEAELIASSDNTDEDDNDED